ncbi:hypothetical protein DPMN_105778 [Dreissena polymorpha]|uniref:Uncharacterized protein n=1 Tax=Dreissena polymorpha TaxID=45954 RepID=A0A9D4K3T7_DREPO|nr:hypothetical protein DPMN_105778 [Dreissena polymorpha]
MPEKTSSFSAPDVAFVPAHIPPLYWRITAEYRGRGRRQVEEPSRLFPCSNYFRSV